MFLSWYNEMKGTDINRRFIHFSKINTLHGG